MVDQRTGDMYCTWIENGEWKCIGSCEYETVEFDLNVLTSTSNMEAIDFSTSPVSAVFNVMGTNWQSAIEYTTPSATGVNWLNLTPTEAETPATVKAEADSSALSAGSYFSKIIITSEDKTKEVEVNLEVKRK